MLVTKSQRVQTTSTIHLHLRSNPHYHASKIFEGVLVRVEKRHITIRNYNQQAVLVNRTTLLPNAERVLTIPVLDGRYPPVFIEIIAYEFLSGERLRILPRTSPERCQK